jgi:hypothetical protein
MRKKFATALFAIVMAFSIGACSREADVVSHNISAAADQFEVLRRVVFYNGITDQYMLTIEGYCSLGNDRTATEISITCKTGGADFKKHFLGLSDNVTYFVEQLDGANVSPDHYRVIFKPSTIIPDIDIQ